MTENSFTSSLNISTYNWPAALNLCLKSVLNQKVLPDEVIIADDGSGPDTRSLIEEYSRSFPVPVKHIWQPDEGFQLAKIRNKAIAASTGDYIIQIDGDLLLHPRFVSDHISFAKQGTFVTGSRVMMSEELSQIALKEQRVEVNIFSRGLSNRSNGFRFKGLRDFLADKYRIKDIYFMRGCNMAFWRNDLILVNGYNEDFIGWGREDNEVAVRLINSGIKKRMIKFGGVVFHIFHTENKGIQLDKNNIILNESLASRKKFCLNGLNKYLNPT